jgi:hypothetical protein
MCVRILQDSYYFSPFYMTLARAVKASLLISLEIFLSNFVSHFRVALTNLDRELVKIFVFC